jgi:tRNA (guanine37-N1)-methyltransferase
MRIDVITLFPGMFDALAGHGITARACAEGVLSLRCWNPREAARDRHRTVDDRPYGGGPGMVMKLQPLRDTLQRIRQVSASRGRVIHLSPQGRPLDQAAVAELAMLPHLVLIAGRYEGIDERFINAHVDQEWSIGDYVLSGGELPAMVLIDAVTRLLPGALGDPESSAQDSFVDGLLDCPHYTRPDRIDECSVPAPLLGGDHAAIRHWRQQQALGRTWLRRPDLLARRELTPEQRELLTGFIATRRPMDVTSDDE